MTTSQRLPNGVTVHKWPHRFAPTAERVAEEMRGFGFKSYDLQTVPAWFVRSRHSHDEEEIRGAVDGVITFHFDEGPVTIEAGDILVIPSGVAHEVKTHNDRTFSAFKGSRSGVRSVTEHGDGKGSVEQLASATATVLVTLDLDGTLEDSRADMVAAIQRVRGALGLPARPDAEFVAHVSRGMDFLYRNAFAEHLGEAPSAAAIEAVAEAYAADYGAHIADTTRLYDGIIEALPALAALAPLAVVTNKPEALSELLLTTLGVREHFVAVIGGDSCAAPKPDPMTLVAAAERAGLRAPRTLHVGDSAGDLRCARAAGATSIWCAWGYLDSAPNDPPPDHVVEHPADLVRLVRDLLAPSASNNAEQPGRHI